MKNPTPPRVVGILHESRVERTFPEDHKTHPGERVIDFDLDYYWAVREPGTIFGTASETEGSSDEIDDDDYYVFGGQPVHIRNHGNIEGLRKLLDAIEADMKPVAE